MRYCLRGIQRQLRHPITFLITLKGALGGTEFRIDLLQTAIDELLGFQGYLVFIGIGLTIIGRHQGIEVINGTTHIVVLKRQFCNRSQFRSGRHRQLTHITGSRDHRRHNRDVQGTTILEGFLHPFLGSCILRKGEGSEFGLDSCRQRLESMLKITGFAIAIIQSAFDHITLRILLDGQTNVVNHIKELLIKPTQMLGIEIDTDRLVLVDQIVLKDAIELVSGVELQTLHRLTRQDMRLEHLHLVLNTCRIGDEAQILHVGQHVRRTTTSICVVLDQHLTGHLKHRTGIAQIDKCDDETSYQRDRKPLPIQD